MLFLRLPLATNDFLAAMMHHPRIFLILYASVLVQIGYQEYTDNGIGIARRRVIIIIQKFITLVLVLDSGKGNQ